MKKHFPWIHLRKKTDPDVPYETPVALGNKSNGEFFHEQTAHERKLRKLILETCDEKARYLGMDRREFIASTMGMATTLSVLNIASGCSSSSGSQQGDGGYVVPPGATLDGGEADAVLGGKEFILDLQTHHIEDEEHWRQTHPGKMYVGDTIAPLLTFYACPDLQTDPIKCVGPDKYLQAVFLGSDTTVAVLSGFPGAICDDATMCGHPVSNEDMVNSRIRINKAAGSERMVQHCQVDPNDKWPLQSQAMEKINKTYGNRGWKVYPAWPAPDTQTGWWMDDPNIAFPFYDRAIELGQPLVCAHKGVHLPGFLDEFLDPKDVGPAAAQYPQISFVIYHSGIEVGYAEGPYDESTPTAELRGMDRLIRSAQESGVAGKNVYAEMGTAWFTQMGNPEAAQHYVGKALKYLGEDHLVWGSECVWFNSPQPQIEAFRALEISQEFQDKYGYPALTPALKAKVFGLSGAKLYGIDPKATRHAIDTDKLSMLRRDLDGELGGRRWMFEPLGGPRTRREFMNLWRHRLSTGHLG
jgi:predicted TIM-barrel fold metal-dependent hydrolase